ncbi:hypothetical protein BGW80DRAFT_1312777 [Lactifluus volemus]|nr:hypothetical protein BGW80DRAFT_1312777 [Lactifluus volemus]
MPLCTNCAQASSVSVLYFLLSSHRRSHPYVQPSCRAPADPYVEHDALVVALDLILLKRGVYRHLLFNRGTPPRKVEENPPRGSKTPSSESLRELSNAEENGRLLGKGWLILRIGAGVVLVDSWGMHTLLRASELNSGSGMSDGEAAPAFLRILLGCLIETASFHGGITLASICVLTALDRIARWRKHPSPPSSIRQQLRYSHISLCLLYSSLTKFMLLMVLSIWGPQVKEDSPRHAYVYKMPLESPLWHLLDDEVLDRTWLVRNMLGGMSAGFGLRVVLDCHPLFTSLVILSGWVIKSAVVSLMWEFEAWLAYSIP